MDHIIIVFFFWNDRISCEEFIFYSFFHGKILSSYFIYFLSSFDLKAKGDSSSSSSSSSSSL